MRGGRLAVVLCAGVFCFVSGCIEGPDARYTGYPPDLHIAVGPNHVVFASNGRLVFYDKNWNVLRDVTPGEVLNCPRITSDPRVAYDTVTGRWFLVEIGSRGPADGDQFGGWCLAVSQTTDPTGPYFVWNLALLQGTFPDYPKIAVSTDKVVLTGNWGTGTGLLVLQKHDLLVGQQVCYAMFNPTANGFFFHTAHAQTYNAADVFLAGLDGNAHVRLRRIRGTPCVDTVSSAAVEFGVGLNQFGPPESPSKDSEDILHTAGVQPRDAVRRDDVVWMAHHQGCTPQGDSQLRDCARYYQFKSITSDPFAPTLASDVLLARAGTYYFFPAVTMDHDKNLVSVVGRSSMSEYPSMYVTGKRMLEAGMRAGAFAMQGSYPYTNGVAGTQTLRWGDYFGAATDPQADYMVYLVGQFSRQTPSPAGWLQFGSYIARFDTRDVP